MNPASVLALISSLYEQIVDQQARIAALQRELDAARAPEGPVMSTPA